MQRTDEQHRQQQSSLARWGHTREGVGLGALVLLAVATRVLLIAHSPFPWGYAWDPYFEGPLVFFDLGRLPRATDCGQCYHPPLFYLVGWPLVWLGHALAAGGEADAIRNVSIRCLSALPLACAGTSTWATYRLLRLFRWRGPSLTWGVATSLFLPVLFFSSYGIEADGLVCAIVSLAALAMVRGFLRHERATLPNAIHVGLLSGLALATKYSGAVAVAAAGLTMLARLATRPRKRAALRDGLVVLGLALAVGGWKYAANVRTFGTPLNANGSAATGFAIEKSLRFDRYRFTDFDLAAVLATMDPVHGPSGRLTRLDVYRSFPSAFYGLVWTDMGLFSREDRLGRSTPPYPRRAIPLWMPGTVLVLGLVPTTLAALGALLTLRRRVMLPLHALLVVSVAIYLQWMLSQPNWAIKPKYLAFLAPIGILHALVALRWIERHLPAPWPRVVWSLAWASVLACVVYLTGFAIAPIVTLP